MNTSITEQSIKEAKERISDLLAGLTIAHAKQILLELHSHVENTAIVCSIHQASGTDDCRYSSNREEGSKLIVL